MLVLFLIIIRQKNFTFTMRVHIQKTIYTIDANIVNAKTMLALRREQFNEAVMRIPVGQSKWRLNDRRIISRFGPIAEFQPAEV